MCVFMYGLCVICMLSMIIASSYILVDVCDSSPEPECHRIVNGYSIYAGRKMTTESGITCQRFDQQTPHSHRFKNATNFYETSLALVENFCRDPDGYGTPWCYTMDSEIRWQVCGIPLCPN